MKTLVKETLAKRLTVVVLALAAIVGICAFAFSGTHNNAWAEGEGPIATWNEVKAPGYGVVKANEKNLSLEIIIASSNDHLEAHITNNDGDTIPPSVLELTTEDGSVLTAYFGEDIPPTNQAASSIEGSDAGTRFTKAELYLIPETVTVTFNMNGYGSQIDPITVKKGTSVTPPEPTDPDYDFGGWFTDESLATPFGGTATESMTVYAKWVPKEKVTVTFDMNGYGSQIDPIKVIKGTPVTLPEDPTAEGLIFNYWTTDAENNNFFDSTQPITVDMTLYAKWTPESPKNVVVTFDLNGHGKFSKDVVTESNGSVKLAAQDGKVSLPVPPTDDEYDFKGWADANKKAFDGSSVPDSMIVYAQWEKKAEPKPDTPADKPSDSGATKPAETTPTDFTIVISKTDAKTGKALSGAEFTLTDKAGNVVDSWTTDGTSRTYTLDRSTSYALTETKAPAGYSREKAININFSTDDDKEAVKIDQGGKAVALPVNNDGNATLNVKDLSGTALKGTGTTAPKTGDSQNMPLASLCFGAAALIAGGIAATAYRKRQEQ
ncbi:MAG: InlB B-repeat-containing protein [Eggerthellaceae bacterium]